MFTNASQWIANAYERLPMLANACYFQSAIKNVLQMSCQYLDKYCEYKWHSPQGGVQRV